MSKDMFIVLLIAVSLGLLVLGQAWQRDLGINRGYSEQDAREFMEASRQWHEAMHQAAESAEDDEGVAEEALEAARKRLETAREVRDQALAARHRQSWLITFAGMVGGVLGLLLAWHSQRSSRMFDGRHALDERQHQDPR